MLTEFLNVCKTHPEPLKKGWIMFNIFCPKKLAKWVIYIGRLMLPAEFYFGYMENTLMLKASLWGINIFSSHAASAALAADVGWRPRRKDFRCALADLLPTLFFSFLFWCLTFAYLPAFQPSRVLKTYLKFVYPLQGNDGPLMRRFECIWKWAIMYYLTSRGEHERTMRNTETLHCKPSLTSLASAKPENQTQLFPGEKSTIFTLYKD